MINPDYSKATNAAYELLAKYQGELPVIDVYRIAIFYPNVKIHTYTDVADRMGIDTQTFIKNHASSEHGFTIKDMVKNRYIIFFSELKDVTTVRFTIAHELGHIVLKHNDDSVAANKEANCFARNLLCPVPISDNFGVQTVQDYVNCFGISEPMAEVTVSYRENDKYYITRNNYNIFNDIVYRYFSGYTLAELYGYC